MCYKCIVVLALLIIIGIAIWLLISKKPTLSTKAECDPNNAPQVTKGTIVNCVKGQWVVEPN